VSLVEARVNDIYRADEIANRLEEKLGGHYVVNNWIHQNKSLFSAMKLEKIMLFITIGLIVLVASFNVISTLVMMVLDKTSDIAILMAMGCTSRQIMRIFMLQGILIGVVGTILGTVLGVVGAWIMDYYKVIQLPLDVYFIPYLPFRVRLVDIAAITLTAFAISFVSTLYPALRASRINPTEALRYE
jgi:lipoprotein-releasing system permease protein